MSGSHGKIGGLKGVWCVSGTAMDGPGQFRGFVTVRAEDVNGGELVGQLDVEAVRTMALQFLQVAEAAEQDAIIFRMLTRDVGSTPDQAAAFVTKMREERAGDGKESQT